MSMSVQVIFQLATRHNLDTAVIGMDQSYASHEILSFCDRGVDIPNSLRKPLCFPFPPRPPEPYHSNLPFPHF